MLSQDAKKRIQEHIADLPESLRSDPATERQLQEFEKNFGAIPEDYRWFLATCGGGIFGPEHVDDIVRLPESQAKFRRESESPKGWKMKDVFVFGWDGSGNPFGIERKTGRVVVEDHNFGGIHELAPSLQDFMLKGI